MPGKRILVVDNGTIHRDELARRIAAAGYVVAGFVNDFDEPLPAEQSADGVLIAMRSPQDQCALDLAQRLVDASALPVMLLCPTGAGALASELGTKPYFCSTLVDDFTQCQFCAAFRHAQDLLDYRAELRRRDTWLHAALTHIHDAAITTETDGRIVTMNRAAEKLTGWPLVEAKGKPVPEVFRTADGFGLIMPGGSIDTEARAEPMILVARDGREHFLDVSAVRVTKPDGEPMGMLLVFSDVGERFRLADSVQQNRQLEILARLAGGVAHDFNNLLLIILGYTEELFSFVEPDSPLREFTGEIRSAAERAVYLTRQLFAFTRRERFAPEIIDLNELLSNSQGLLSRLLGEHCRLSYQLCGGTALVKVDPAHVEQVVVNLAIRARAAAGRRGTFTIRTECPAGAALPAGASAVPYVLLQVHDDGAELTDEELRCLREPLLAARTASDRSIGLSVVANAVRQNGGFIEAESCPAGGTDCRIYWPQVMRKSEAIAPAPAAAGKETILLVEDEDVVRALTRLMLTRRGYHVLDAKGGVDALRLLDHYAGGIDLLLTDMMMPEMSGIELARCARAARPSIRVLCMSGYTEDSLADLGIADGEIEWIEKPFSSDELASAVRRILVHQHPAPASPEDSGNSVP